MMKRSAVLSVGFRPWFLSLLVAGVILFGLWGWVWFSMAMGGMVPASSTINAVIGDWRWHAHEMVFGLGTALLSGFLLTAVQNWTGERVITPGQLLSLVLLWWVARSLFFLEGMSGWSGFIASAAVPLWVAVAILRPLRRHRQWRNLIFPGALVTLSLLDLSFRGGMHRPDFQSEIAWAGLWPLVAVVLFMAQRIIPAFTGNFIGRRNLDLGHPLAWISGGGPFLLLVLSVLPLAMVRPVLAPIMTLSIVLWGAYALRHWWDRRILREPMLLVLFVGYFLIMLGLLILAVAQTTLLPPSLHGSWLDAAIHALGLGILGVFGPGMLLRVSAGHTGRVIEMPGLLRWAFGAAVLFWLVRVAILAIGFHPAWLAFAAWGMAGVYLALLLSIASWLIRPRLA